MVLLFAIDYQLKTYLVAIMPRPMYRGRHYERRYNPGKPQGFC